MLKHEAQEAAEIVSRVLDGLLTIVASRGREGSALRTACGDLKVNGVGLIQTHRIAEPLARCFDLAIAAGATFQRMIPVHTIILLESPVSLAAILMRDASLMFYFVAQSRIVSDMTFVSREHADQIKVTLNTTFDAAQEIISDTLLDAMTYRALVSLHAAVSFHLVETARPLPRMLNFAFASPMPTILIAHRLYDDAGRADELRSENKTIHPLFSRATGRALSA